MHKITNFNLSVIRTLLARKRRKLFVGLSTFICQERRKEERNVHLCGYLAVAGLFAYFLVVSLHRFRKQKKDVFVTD